ncbi:hypothetical protein E2562_024173 [Oryza meyeriana var. granulata]|uniref:Uncharacterized protein n=1 Tax=Oryza meyeriana var. granulata TaxID=110450 RepID=A0A6G1CI24_9ORYZ|nr:hypothetical protein E2562_024173 [Oryza meyeriana var. granulata]
MPDLKELEMQKGAMTSLQRLTLVNLNLADVPSGIQFLMPLQHPGFLEITKQFLKKGVRDARAWQLAAGRKPTSMPTGLAISEEHLLGADLHKETMS